MIYSQKIIPYQKTLVKNLSSVKRIKTRYGRVRASACGPTVEREVTRWSSGVRKETDVSSQVIGAWQLVSDRREGLAIFTETHYTIIQMEKNRRRFEKDELTESE